MFHKSETLEVHGIINCRIKQGIKQIIYYAYFAICYTAPIIKVTQI